NAPEDIFKGERFAFIRGTPRLLGSPYRFARHGQSGAEISELLPHLRTIADDVAILRSVHTTQFNHAPAQIFMNTGHQIVGRPSPGGVRPEDRRASLDLVNELNRTHLEEQGDPEIQTRIASYEMAYRMQTSVPELMDIAKEPPAMHELYGTEPGQRSFANNCLLARRLVERGVRFVQLYHR